MRCHIDMLWMESVGAASCFKDFTLYTASVKFHLSTGRRRREREKVGRGEGNGQGRYRLSKHFHSYLLPEHGPEMSFAAKDRVGAAVRKDRRI